MNILSLLSKIDLKTGIAIAVVLAALAYATVERIRRSGAENAREEAVADRTEALRAQLAAEALAMAYERSYEQCKASLDTVIRIAKEETEASQKRVARLRREIEDIKPEVAEGDYTLRDVVNDARRW